MPQKTISVCIPTYEMAGHGQDFLRHSFEILEKQTFRDFDIVISDHSKDLKIKKLCEEFEGKLTIHYYKNIEKVGVSSANINNAIRNATGKIIKILFQDDFLYSEKALEQTIEHFNLTDDYWLVSASEHTRDGESFYRPFYPRYNRNIQYGENTISSPSVLTIKNESPLFFDEELIWLMDCDYYKRCYDAFGLPKILREITVVNRVGEHQVSQTDATDTVKQRELAYVTKKYEKKDLGQVTLVSVSSVKLPETIKALQQSKRGLAFAEVLLISHEKPKDLPMGISFKKAPKLTSIDEYSKFMAYDLASYIQTEYALVVQYDGYVLRPGQWRNVFLEYDYMGAPWPPGVHFANNGKNIRVGNGGFSLRSKKMLNALNYLKLPFTDNGTGYFNEDGLLCGYYRKELEEYGIRYAPVPVASRFSREATCDDSQPRPFGFHKNKHLIPLTLLSKRYF